MAEDVAERMNWPTATWPGNCYGVAVQMLRDGIVEGEPRYGAYLGPVDDKCPIHGFKSTRGTGLTRHGWIEQRDGTIIDPTRWVFLGWQTAHIFIIPPDDDRQEDYDVAAQGMAEATLSLRPVPTRETGMNEMQRKPIPLEGISDEAMDHLRGLLGDTTQKPLTLLQWSWIGNAPIRMLEPFTREVYEAMKADESMYLGAHIPRDHYDHVMNLWSEDV